MALWVFFWHINLSIHQNMSIVIYWRIDTDIVINHFFVSLFTKIKQVDSMLPCICSVIDHRRSQNVVKISVTHWPNCLCVTFFVFTIFDVICDQLLKQTQQQHKLNILN